MSEHKRVLITVRTYPVPAQRGIEVSCTAGVTDDGRWIRLYPVPYRRMDVDKRFAKYQWIDIDVTKAKGDPRPESYTPDIDSIRIGESIPPARNWAARRDIVQPLISHCLCCIKKKAAADGSPTLGLFKAHSIDKLIIAPDSPNWSADELAKLRRYSMFVKAPAQQLEKIPFKFEYRFRCDHPECNGHSLSSTDWEMLESCRRWKRQYRGEWETKFRQRYERDMTELNDTHFFVGNQLAYPNAWLVVGLFYPRHDAATRRLL